MSSMMSMMSKPWKVVFCFLIFYFFIFLFFYFFFLYPCGERENHGPKRSDKAPLLALLKVADLTIVYISC